MLDKISKFVKESVEWLQKEQQGCCTYELDDHLAVCVGWSGGYGEEKRNDIIQAKDDPDYGINVGIKVWSNHPKVKDVAVIGLADKRLGEITGAIISIKDGMECTEAEIEEFCLDLPRYKRPKKIIFADVPRNATGKIEKPALRKKYGVENLVAQENMG
ncbi:MAG: hypothetical protein II220_04125 [Spirochaetales bacterium]|nr:hypothetical protein [Spirochaetales bacterium]